MSGLATGILKNTTGTGAPSIAVAGDFPTLNQNTSGYAEALKSDTTTVVVSGADAPTAGQVLTATSGTAARWETPSAGFADPMTTIGDTIIRNGSNVTDRLAIGTAGQVLTVSGGLPVWSAPGGSGYNITTVTTTSSSPSDTTGERILLCDAATAGGNITINLPTAVSNTAKFTIKKIDSGSNKIIIDPNSTQTIEGLTTWELFSQYDSISIVSDNANWMITA
jgi:hypothetical protein